MLLENGAQVNERNAGGVTPIFLATKGKTDNIANEVSDHEAQDYAKCVNLLLEHGAQINVADQENRSCLQWACLVANVNFVQLFIKYNANVHERDNEGFSSLHAACEHYNIVDCTGHTPEHLICLNDQAAQCVQLLLTNGANVNEKSHKDWTPLHSACNSGKAECVQVLIANGANVNAKSHDYTSLHAACDKGHLECAQLLIAHGAQINDRDDEGWTLYANQREEGIQESYSSS